VKHREKSGVYIGMRWIFCLCMVTLAGCHGAVIPEPVEAGREIEIVLPALSDYFVATEPTSPAVLEWHLQWWNGREVKGRILSDRNPEKDHTVTFRVAGTGAYLFVVCAAPILMPQGIALGGYGGWGYPPDRRCVLTLDRGCLSRTALRVAEDGLSPELINLERIQEAIDGVYAGGAEAIDAGRLEEGLRGLAFRQYHVRPLSRPVLEVRRLKEGDDQEGDAGRVWFTDDQRVPRSEAVVAGDYLVWSVPVAPGETRKFWRPGEKMTLTRTDEGHGSFHIFRLY
jgi:hypothetical protein